MQCTLVWLNRLVNAQWKKLAIFDSLENLDLGPKVLVNCTPNFHTFFKKICVHKLNFLSSKLVKNYFANFAHREMELASLPTRESIQGLKKN